MNMDKKFSKAYSLLRNELLTTEFPIELAHEIALIYEAESKNKVVIGNSLIIHDFLEHEALHSLLDDLKKQYIHLLKETSLQLNPYDPIFCELDAFSHIEWGLEEVPHTKMLAFFLNPSLGHGLGNLPMGYFLAAISSSEVQLPSINDYKDLSVGLVEAEKWIKVNGEDRRLDVYIEMKKPNFRILIEGKINGEQIDEQLNIYEKWLAPQTNDLLIFLTPDGDQPYRSSWNALDWSRVGASFSALLHFQANKQDCPEAINTKIGLDLLRLWTSTLIHHVCEIPIVKYRYEDDKLANLAALTSHILKIKEIHDTYNGGEYAN